MNVSHPAFLDRAILGHVMCHAQCHICHAQLAHESASSQPVQGMSFYDWPGDDIQGLTCINQDLNVMGLEDCMDLIFRFRLGIYNIILLFR